MTERLRLFALSAVGLILLRHVTGGGIAAALATMAFVLVLPGLYLDRFLPSEEYHPAGQLGRWTALSLGFWALPALAAYHAQVSLDIMTPAVFLLVLLLALAPSRRIVSNVSFRPAGVVLGLGLAIAAVLYLYEPLFIPDTLWDTGTWRKIAAVGRAVNLTNLAASPRPDPLYGMDEWMLLLGWITRFSGADALQVTSLSHLLLAPVILSALAGFLSALDTRRSFLVGGLAGFLLFHLYHEGGWIFFTSHAQAVVTDFVLWPVLFALAARERERLNPAEILAAGLVSASLVMIHPVAFGWALLVLASQGIMARLLKLEPAARQAVAVFLVSLVAALPYLVIRAAAIRYDNPVLFEPYFTVNLGAGLEIISPAALLDPEYHVAYRNPSGPRNAYLAAVFALPLALWRFRRERWARWAVATSLLMLAVPLNPVAAPLLNDGFSDHIVRRIAQTFPVWELLAGTLATAWCLARRHKWLAAAALLALPVAGLPLTGAPPLLPIHQRLPRVDAALEITRPNLIHNPILTPAYRFDLDRLMGLLMHLRSETASLRVVLCGDDVAFPILGYTSHFLYVVYPQYNAYLDEREYLDRRNFQDAVLAGRVPLAEIATALRTRRIDLIIVAQGGPAADYRFAPGLTVIYEDRQWLAVSPTPR